MDNTKSTQLKNFKNKKLIDLYKAQLKPSFFYYSMTRNFSSFLIRLKKSDFYKSFNEMNNMEVKSKLYDYIFDISKYKESDLYSSELAVRTDVTKLCVYSDEMSDEEEYRLYNEIHEKTKELIKKEMKKILDTINGFDFFFTLEGLSKKEKNDLFSLSKKLLLNNKEMKEEMCLVYKKKIKEEQVITVFDINIRDNAVWILDLRMEIEDMIDSNIFFKVDRYVLTERVLLQHAEYFKFEEDIDSYRKKTISISNSFNSKKEAFIEKNTYLFYSEDEALNAGMKKIRKLKNALNDFEKTRKYTF